MILCNPASEEVLKKTNPCAFCLKQCMLCEALAQESTRGIAEAVNALRGVHDGTQAKAHCEYGESICIT